jgi:hypothetical protein
MAPPDAAAPVISCDLTCVGCGYNLRTLARDALCPECATPVEQSCRAPDLDAASPAWLRRIRRGYLLLFAGGVSCGLGRPGGWSISSVLLRGESLALLAALQLLLITLAGYTRALFPPLPDSETGALAALSFFFLAGAAFAALMAGAALPVGLELLSPLFVMIGVCVEVLGLLVLAAAFAAASAELRAAGEGLGRS